jgi:hypothetical protein
MPSRSMEGIEETGDDVGFTDVEELILTRVMMRPVSSMR